MVPNKQQAITRINDKPGDCHIYGHFPLDKMASNLADDILKMHFHEGKVLYFDSNFTEVCS